MSTIASHTSKTFMVTVRTASATSTYPAIGDIGRLIDAAYDAGALGVTAILVRVPK